jgi:hypothetical protein
VLERPGLESFKEAYLRLDRRVLGIFRILLGLVLLYDVLRRLPDARLLWSSEGVLSTDTLRRAPQAPVQFSFLMGLDSGWAVELAFAGLACLFVLYTIGLFSPVVRVLTLLGYASLNARNLFFEDGGTSVTILLLTWTLWLPLGERFSLDAIRCEARLPSVLLRARARCERRAPLLTLAALILLLQAAAIYWLNAAHKTGHTWKGGDAVHLVLWQHRVNTPIALWFAQYEPGWFSPISTWFAVWVEYLLPVCLLWPSHSAIARSVAFVMAVLLHGSIALIMTLGPFSYAMICLVWLTLPGSVLDALAARLPRRLGWRLARQRARLVRGWRQRFGAAVKRDGARLPAWWPRAREAALGMMLVIEVANLLSYNRAIPEVLKTSAGRFIWEHSYKPYLRGMQRWSMFAPNAPEEDGALVIDAVTKSGRHVDPFTGTAPDFERLQRGGTPHSIAVSDYLLAMRAAKNKRYRPDLSRYLRGYSPSDPIVSAQAWWVSRKSPRRGVHTPGPLRKEQLWKLKT